MPDDKASLAYLCGLSRNHVRTFYRHLTGDARTMHPRTDMKVPVLKFCRVMKIAPQTLQKLMSGQDQAINATEAAHILGCSVRSVHRWLHPVVPIKGAYRYLKSDVLAQSAMEAAP